MHQEENAGNAFATKPTLLFSLATLVLAFVAVGWKGGMPSAEAQGSAPVTVVNTPLPVSLSGTGTITGNVNASQAGAWSVGVTSMPAIQLAPGTTVGVTGVDVNVNAKNASVVYLCASTNTTCPGVTIPVGTRYVIEQVAGECNVGSESSMDGWRLTAQINGADHLYYFNDKIEAGGGETTLGAFFELTRIYADGGVADGISAKIFGAGGEHKSATCNITLSGYLVSLTS